MRLTVPSEERAWELAEWSFAEGGDAFTVVGWADNGVTYWARQEKGPNAYLHCEISQVPERTHEDAVLIIALRVPHPDHMSFDEVVTGEPA